MYSLKTLTRGISTSLAVVDAIVKLRSKSSEVDVQLVEAAFEDTPQNLFLQRLGVEVLRVRCSIPEETRKPSLDLFKIRQFPVVRCEEILRAPGPLETDQSSHSAATLLSVTDLRELAEKLEKVVGEALVLAGVTGCIRDVISDPAGLVCGSKDDAESGELLQLILIQGYEDAGGRAGVHSRLVVIG